MANATHISRNPYITIDLCFRVHEMGYGRQCSRHALNRRDSTVHVHWQYIASCVAATVLYYGLPSCCRGSVTAVLPTSSFLLQNAVSPRLRHTQKFQITPYLQNEKTRKCHLHFACALLSLWSRSISIDRHTAMTTVILATHARRGITKRLLIE